jgi:serine/threonine-protein kinase
MDVANWVQLSSLLDRALDLPPGERDRWLDTLGPEYDSVKPQLQALLAHASSPEIDAWLRTLPKITSLGGGLGTGSEPVPIAAGTTVGPYQVQRALGEGGMGSVWLAERTDGLIRRPVALKLPRGPWPPAILAERFSRERDIVAGLEHPHIARLYDAGVASDGRPYLALEYVEGRPLDLYSREHRLDVRERIRVFLQVVHAVAYAHSRLVVHRDLKPSNILVTATGEVRLLDFGIAKLLDTGPVPSLLTEAGGGPHTPEYASPEQVAGESPGTASDVYSLGVVLYELLTGVRPYGVSRESRRALEDAILDAVIRPPSTVATDPGVARALHGDIDTIVLKALRKAPAERYATARELADDLERWLQGRPVMARPDCFLYRLRKFIGRNRMASGAAAAAVVMLVAGTTVALWQAHEARVQRNVARSETARANEQAAIAQREARVARANAELADYLTADLSTGRSTTDLEGQLDRALAMVRSQYRDDPFLRVRLMTAIAGRFRQLASFDRHRELVTELEATARAVSDTDSVDQLQCWRARDLSQAGNAAPADALIAGVLSRLRQRRPLPTAVLASCLADESAIARLAGDSRRALSAIEEVRRLEEADGRTRTDEHADTLLLLARAYGQTGRYRDGVEAATRSADLRTELGRADTPGMMNVTTIGATLLRDGGRPDRALPILQELLARHVARGGAPESIPPLEYDIALTLVRLGRPVDALPLLERSGTAARSRGDATLIRATSVARIIALADAGRLEEAATLRRELEPMYVRLRADRQYIARLFLFAAAHLALARGNLQDAHQAVEEARAVVARVNNSTDPAWRFVHFYAAQIALRAGRPDEARDAAAAALEYSRRQAVDPDASVFIAEDLTLRALAFQALGRLAEAARDAQLADQQLVAVTPTHPWRGAVQAAALSASN